MLQTNFFLLIENFMTRRYSITAFCRRWIRSLRALGRFLHEARAVFVSLQTSHFGYLGKCVKTLCLSGGLLVFGLLNLSANTGRLVDSSSEHTLISSGVVPVDSTVGPTLVRREVHQVEAQTFRDGSLDAWTGGICSRSPDAWPGLGHRIEDLFETGLLVFGHLGFAIGRPTHPNGHWVYEVLEKLPQLAHGSQTLHFTTLPSLINDGDSHTFHSHFFAP